MFGSISAFVKKVAQIILFPQKMASSNDTWVSVSRGWRPQFRKLQTDLKDGVGKKNACQSLVACSSALNLQQDHQMSNCIWAGFEKEEERVEWKREPAFTII